MQECGICGKAVTTREYWITLECDYLDEALTLVICKECFERLAQVWIDKFSRSLFIKEKD